MLKLAFTLNRTLLDSELACDLLSDGVKRPSTPVAAVLPSAKCECFSLHEEHNCTIPKKKLYLN